MKAAIELVPVTYAITQAVPHIPRATVPDMPDRIIAATALHLGVPLVSRDRKIHASSIQTIW
jgi:PIN domain nuclease of toxin-antitoxin system